METTYAAEIAFNCDFRPILDLDKRQTISLVFIQDLKNRGLFEDTLIVWAGNSDALPWDRKAVESSTSRGLHVALRRSVKVGIYEGNTDELGYSAVENLVHVRDFLVTMLKFFGIDQNKQT